MWPHAWAESMPSRGSWIWPLGRDPAHTLKECVRADGKSALTHYKVLDPSVYGAFISEHSGYSQHSEKGNQLTWVALKLGSGRTHQIRVHLQQAGRPVLKDGLYGVNASSSNPEEPVLAWPPVMALHAYRLRFHHPIYQQPLDFYRAPLHWRSEASAKPEFSGDSLPAFENL